MKNQKCLNCENIVNFESNREICHHCGYVNDLNFEDIDSAFDINVKRIKSFSQNGEQACWNPKDLELKLIKLQHENPSSIVIGGVTVSIPKGNNKPRIYIPNAYTNDPRLLGGKEYKYIAILIPIKE